MFAIIHTVTYWCMTRQACKAAELRKVILDFGQSHSHLEGCIHKQIAKTQRKKNEQDSPAAIVVAPEPQPDADDENSDMRAEASFSYGPNSGYLAQAVSASTKTNISQFSFERIDRRTKVMHSQMKKRQTVCTPLHSSLLGRLCVFAFLSINMFLFVDWSVYVCTCFCVDSSVCM